MSALPLSTALYGTDAVRRIDAAAIRGGVAGYTLMTRAAQASFALLRDTWPDARRITVVCGLGNNGGDGCVLARLAQEAALGVQLVALPGEPPAGSDAAQARADWLASGDTIIETDSARLPPGDVVVDALFGIGLSRAPQGAAAALIEAINAQGAPVLALDVPSGVDADSGHVPSAAVNATVTISFIAHKRGLHSGAALDHVGRLELADLDVDATAFAGIDPAASLVHAEALALLPGRRANAHKGSHGHVLAIGGDHGGGGAIRLCAEAALRTGAGLVSVFTRADHVAPLLGGRPECMVHACEGEIPEAAARASVLAIGPGLGQGDWGRALFERFIDDPRPLVLDADALNLLARSPRLLHARRILTPHPGEAARLLDVDIATIQRDRCASAAELATRYAATIVLKGAGSVIAAPGIRPIIIGAGNPGMASGGMGDVLTGVIAGLSAQGLGDFDAAWLGALLHAVAGDRAAAAGGQRGLLASDLFPYLRGDADD
ncbi:MAG: NAD(P)H-hydrate dehydratase [Lysobacteraceae bacterium]